MKNIRFKKAYVSMNSMDLKGVWAKINEKNSLAGTAFYIVLGFAIAIGVNWGLGFAFQTDTPVVAVFSNSMVPEFYKGDMIIVATPAGNPTGMAVGGKNLEYKVGDIVVFDASTGNYKYPIIHRIIAVNPDGTYETKGDANSGQGNFEHNVKASQIHGKAVFRIPLLGWVKVGFFEGLGLAKE